MDYRTNMAVYILSGPEMPLENPKAEKAPLKEVIGRSSSKN
jgi:hypothetical protein